MLCIVLSKPSAISPTLVTLLTSMQQDALTKRQLTGERACVEGDALCPAGEEDVVAGR